MPPSPVNLNRLSIAELRRMAAHPVLRTSGVRLLGDMHQYAAIHDGAPDQANMLFMAWLADWHRFGCPTVECSHRYAAALAATSIPDLEIHAPWPAFAITMPTGLVHTVADDGAIDPVHRLIVVELGGIWSFVALTNRCRLNQFSRPTAGIRATESNEDLLSPGVWLPMNDADGRALRVCGQLILNLCVAMSDPRLARPIGKVHERGPASTPCMLPGGTFDVSQPVRVDCREVVQEYLGGRRSSLPAVRWLVRGHWRNQAHGPARSMRTMKWIEPHWKGDSDAPQAERPHVLISRC